MNEIQIVNNSKYAEGKDQAFETKKDLCRWHSMLSVALRNSRWYSYYGK